MPQIFPLSTQKCSLRFRNRTPHTKVITARQIRTTFLRLPPRFERCLDSLAHGIHGNPGELWVRNGKK